MDAIDRHAMTPMYHQLAEFLRGQIRSGELEAGKLLPSERALMQKYGLSRNTVRQAVDQLAREGLIVREHGHGTYVSTLSNKFHYMLDTFYENRDLLKLAGYTPSAEFISTAQVIPPEAARIALKLPPDEKTICHTMVFYADGRPAMFTRDYLPAHMTGKYDLSTEGEGFMRFLDRVSGLQVEYVLVDISPVEAGREIAQTFGRPSGTPALLMMETFLDVTQTRPIAFSMNYFNQEVLNFRLLMQRG
jgi:GntR family transcriptional regulator